MGWQCMGNQFEISKLHILRRLFLKTGLLMTANGTDDEYIQPQGFTNYSF